MFFLRDTITVDCAIYRLPLCSICKGKGKEGGKGERRKEKKKGKGERERRKEKGKKENKEGERERRKGKGEGNQKGNGKEKGEMGKGERERGRRKGNHCVSVGRYHCKNCQESKEKNNRYLPKIAMLFILGRAICQKQRFYGQAAPSTVAIFFLRHLLLPRCNSQKMVISCDIYNVVPLSYKLVYKPH